MKNAIKNIFGIIALAAAAGFVVVACDKSSDTAAPTSSASGQLSGTYVGEDGQASITFSGNKGVQRHGGHGHEFTYEIKDGKMIITFEHETDECDFTLEGDKLTLVNKDGQTLVLTKQ